MGTEINNPYNPTDYDSFLELTDTPSTYTSKGLELVRVNTGEDGLEFSGVKLSDIDYSGGYHFNEFHVEKLDG